MELKKTLWYLSLIDDVETLVVEGTFSHHWTLIETYHHIGRRILLDKENFGTLSINKITQRIAEDTGRGQRMLQYAVKFHEKFPDLALLPEGKNVTMRKIINMYLTDGKKEKKVKLFTCPKCGEESEI